MLCQLSYASVFARRALLAGLGVRQTAGEAVIALNHHSGRIAQVGGEVGEGPNRRFLRFATE